jgi:hypothetical protein
MNVVTKTTQNFMLIVKICFIFRQHVLLSLRYPVKGLHTTGSGKRSYSSLVHGSSPLSLAISSWWARLALYMYLQCHDFTNVNHL